MSPKKVLKIDFDYEIADGGGYPTYPVDFLTLGTVSSTVMNITLFWGEYSGDYPSYYEDCHWVYNISAGIALNGLVGLTFAIIVTLMLA